jgi:hypothetical protein
MQLHLMQLPVETTLLATKPCVKASVHPACCCFASFPSLQSGLTALLSAKPSLPTVDLSGLSALLDKNVSLTAPQVDDLQCSACSTAGQ